MKFTVEVYRDTSTSRVFEVEASDAEEAKRIALDELAPNYSFYSPSGADYSCATPRILSGQTVELPCYNMKIIVCGENIEDSSITSEINDGGMTQEQKVATAALESIILAHVCAGVDVTTTGYIEGIETSVQKIYDMPE